MYRKAAMMVLTVGMLFVMASGLFTEASRAALRPSGGEELAQTTVSSALSPGGGDGGNALAPGGSGGVGGGSLVPGGRGDALAPEVGGAGGISLPPKAGAPGRKAAPPRSTPPQRRRARKAAFPRRRAARKTGRRKANRRPKPTAA